MYKINKLKLFYLVIALISTKLMFFSVLILTTENKDHKLMMIQQLLLAGFMLLLGTESLFCRKNKKGYIYYIVGVFNFIAFFSLLQLTVL